MSIDPTVIQALAEADPETQQLAFGAISQLDPEMMARMVGDAQRAYQLRASGDEAGCRAIVEQYRQLAEGAGLGGIFAQMFDGSSE